MIRGLFLPALLAALVGWSGVAATPAGATQLIPRSLPELARGAPVIFVGRCAAVSSHWNASRSLIFTASRFRVARALKGTPGPVITGGDGLDDVTANGFSGPDIDFDPADVGLYESSGGTLIFIIPLQVRVGAAPGARNIYLESDEEVAVLAGGVRVTGE
jgi:hypothetical protein